MDLIRAMRAFTATVQAGSMTGAAASLGISAAMVGQHVSALEERLGTRLLHRTTRKQSLTQFGAVYFEQCVDILGRIALAEEEAAALQEAPRGRLRITAPTSFGAEALMPALAGYRETAPDVTLDVILSDRSLDLVEDAIDVAFRIGRLEDSSLIARPLAPYRMLVCAASAYLERAGMPYHPEELARHEIIAFTASAGRPWRFSKAGEEMEVRPTSPITVNSGQAVRMAARAGLGIVQQPEILLREDLREGRLVRLFADWPAPERPMSLMYYRDRLMTPRLRSFIAFALETFGPEP